MKVIELTILYA